MNYASINLFKALSPAFGYISAALSVKMPRLAFSMVFAFISSCALDVAGNAGQLFNHR